MEGKGTYMFPTGTRYEGELKDSMFHGKGTLFFTNGSKYEATWDNGYAVEVSCHVQHTYGMMTFYDFKIFLKDIFHITKFYKNFYGITENTQVSVLEYTDPCCDARKYATMFCKYHLK